MQKGPPQAYVEHLIRRVLECVACPRLCATQISIIHAHSTSQLVYSIITHTRQTRSSQKLRVRPPTHTTTTKHTEENPSKMYCTVFFCLRPRVCVYVFVLISEGARALARPPVVKSQSPVPIAGSLPAAGWFGWHSDEYGALAQRTQIRHRATNAKLQARRDATTASTPSPDSTFDARPSLLSTSKSFPVQPATHPHPPTQPDPVQTRPANAPAHQYDGIIRLQKF